MRFTPAIAASFGAKGGIASGESRKRESEPAPPVELPAELPQKTQQIPLLSASFQNRSLKRVRSHFTKALDKFGIVLNAEPLNAIALRGIADTLARLEEIERRFSGRGLPANVKPAREGRRGADAAPMVVDLGDVTEEPAAAVLEPQAPPTPQAPTEPAGLPPPVGVSLPNLSNLGE
jgi:hypothetical protein